MTKINGATKRGQALLTMANRYEGKYLSDVYGRYSSAKLNAYEDCLEWCRETNGYNFHIISANTFGFSVAWQYNDPNTGEIMTRIETPKNTYIIDGSRARERGTTNGYDTPY